jgi:cytochrome c-type biogenesis protein CcmH
LSLAAVLAAAPAFADGEHGAGDPAAGELDFNKYVPGAAALEGRIIAPCCWNQTIDIHGSPSSTDLRREIRDRLTNGESADAIERSLVERYGPKILATPQGSRLGKTGVLLAMILGAAGVGAVVLLRRWQRRSDEAQPEGDAKPNGSGRRDALDDRLDAELSRLE